MPEVRRHYYRKRRSKLAREKAAAALKEHPRKVRALSGAGTAMIGFGVAASADFFGVPFIASAYAKIIGPLLGAAAGALLAEFLLFLLHYVGASSKIWDADRQNIEALTDENERLQSELTQLTSARDSLLAQLGERDSEIEALKSTVARLLGTAAPAEPTDEQRLAALRRAIMGIRSAVPAIERALSPLAARPEHELDDQAKAQMRARREKEREYLAAFKANEVAAYRRALDIQRPRTRRVHEPHYLQFRHAPRVGHLIEPYFELGEWLQHGTPDLDINVSFDGEWLLFKKAGLRSRFLIASQVAVTNRESVRVNLKPLLLLVESIHRHKWLRPETEPLNEWEESRRHYSGPASPPLAVPLLLEPNSGAIGSWCFHVDDDLEEQMPHLFAPSRSLRFFVEVTDSISGRRMETERHFIKSKRLSGEPGEIDEYPATPPSPPPPAPPPTTA